MPILFLCLALSCSFSIALLIRRFEKKQSDRVVIIAANYITAGALAYTFAKEPSQNPLIYIFGIVLGLFFFIAFIVYSEAIKSQGIASAVTMGRLSLAIPVGFSIFLWGETPESTDIISLIVIFIIILTWENKIGKLSLPLLALFMLFGFMDAAIKYFKLQFPNTDDSFFLIMVFLSAMVWSWLYVFFTRHHISVRDVLKGLFLGIPNYGATFFLLLTLETIPAYIAFPFVNIGSIITSALLSHFYFKEHLDRKKWILIGLGVLSVLFLTT